MISRAAAARYALVAAAAEHMFDGSSLEPVLDASLAADWSIVGYLTAANALFGAQRIGIGDRVFYGFLAQSHADPSLYVVAVRGTELALEWLEDAEAALAFNAQAGLVHAGFWSIFASMAYRDEVISAPRAALGIIEKIGPGATVVAVGHSLGAPLATYLMADLALNGGGSIGVSGALFACPKPGDANYAHYVDKIVGHDNYGVFNYSRDAVPHLPFSMPFGLGFQPLVNVTWITPGMAEVRIDGSLKCCHSALCYAALLDPTLVSPGNACVLGAQTPPGVLQ